jgi:sec-independent protein translocase protein TatA
MGNLGMTEILLIGVALLIFFGPSKLPQLGKSLGQGIQEFKKASKAITEDLP